jgi:hypothetical protein
MTSHATRAAVRTLINYSILRVGRIGRTIIKVDFVIQVLCRYDAETVMGNPSSQDLRDRGYRQRLRAQALRGFGNGRKNARL